MVILGIFGIILGVVLILWAVLSIGVGIASKKEEEQEKDELWY